MEAPIIDFWFEVFTTHTNGSTETVFNSGKMSNALKYKKEDANFLVDLWVVDQTVKDMPVPVMTVTVKTTLEEIRKELLDSGYVSTDGLENIMERLALQFSEKV
jgi:hypothetical protein